MRLKRFVFQDLKCCTQPYLTFVASFQADVTLDPATAAAWLLLSPDGKKVRMQLLIYFIHTIHTHRKLKVLEQFVHCNVLKYTELANKQHMNIVQLDWNEVLTVVAALVSLFQIYMAGVSNSHKQ